MLQFQELCRLIVDIQEFLGAKNILCITKKGTSKSRKTSFRKGKLLRRKKSGSCKKEADYARCVGLLTEDGTPLITVVAACCWSERSYRSNYNALSVVGVTGVLQRHATRRLNQYNR